MVVKEFTSCTNVEQSVFKQTVTGNKVLLLFVSSEEVVVYVHHRVL